jgi:photosystem II stability/assembly factor-like uncharacterized protein
VKQLWSSFLGLFLIFGFTVGAQVPNYEALPAKFRNVGPFRGGRSVCATGVKGDPLTYYMGTTGGGVWKTTDAGQYWENISDGYFQTGSVGAIAVSESHPNIVYVGMGEHAPRGVMTSYGDGVYKSLDGGQTWKKMGLDATQHISRIRIDPRNPDLVFVAAQGALHAPNPERGVYKSTDGGLTWERVLFVDENTGAVELSMDQNYPNVLYAAMWEHGRKPWQVISGGPGSGLYKSVDSGATWIELKEGLPSEMGKMAISVSGGNSNKVYALIESDSEKDLGGLFVSNDGGAEWSRVSDDNRLTQRAWYYIEVFADPNDEHTVYVMSAPALRSIDGGKTWEVLPSAHGDYHDLWINPDNSKNMVLADDGGAAISFNGGATWSQQSNMPTAQLYRINTDNLFPYNLYAGQQDNTSIKLASIGLGRGGITLEHMAYSAGGESAFLAFDPDQPTKVLGGSYLGTIEVLDVASQASTNIMIEPIQYLGRDASDMKYRYNWNAPIIWSQHEPQTVYHGAQYLLRSRDLGTTWEVISPDLTKNEKEKQGKGGVPYTNEAVGAENYGTLAYVVESPHEAGVIWTGSDDGWVHLTKDGGESWTNVTPKGLPECLINAIEVSPHDPGTAYIATTRYKFNDYTPAIYKTHNYGKSWEAINQGIPYGAFTRVVREDSEVAGLLYAGTERGLYLSKDGGEHWTSFQLNLPVTPITDLKVAHNDLVVATSGRSFWILDDLNVVRALKKATSVPWVYTPDATIDGNWYSPMNGDISDFDGTDKLEGVNPASGIVIYYHLPEDQNTKEEVVMEIMDEEGGVIRRFSSVQSPDYVRYDGGPGPEPVLSTRPGVNRIVWDLRHTSLPGVKNVYIESSYRGHKVKPGTYTIKVSTEKGAASTIGVVLPHPLYVVSESDWEEYHTIMSDMEAKVLEMHTMVAQLEEVLNQVVNKLKKIDKSAETAKVLEMGEALVKDIKSWDEDMVQRKSKAYDDVENFPNKFTANYMFLMNQTESQIPKVNKGSRDRKAELDQEWETLKFRGRHLLDESIAKFNQLAQNAGIGVISY